MPSGYESKGWSPFAVSQGNRGSRLASSTNAAYGRHVVSGDMFGERNPLHLKDCSKHASELRGTVPTCSQDDLRPWMLKLAFLFTVACGLCLSGIVLKFSTHAGDVIIMAEGDQVLLPLSTHFNDGVETSSSNTADNELLRVSLLPDLPRISENITSYQAGVQFTMAAGTFQSWGLNLIAGTNVKISICSDSQVQFYILKGEYKMTTWSQQILYDDYDFHLLIPPRNTCDTFGRYKTHLLAVNETDSYFLLFASSLAWRFISTIKVVLDYNRTYYNTSMAYSCLASDSDCVLNLAYASKQIALLELLPPGNGSRNPFRTAKIAYVPKARAEFYVRLFGGIFVAVFILTVLYTLWRICCVAFYRNDLEKKPLLKKLDSKIREMKMRKMFRSLPQKVKREDAWIVVSRVARSSSKESLFDVASHDSESLLGIADSAHAVQGGDSKGLLADEGDADSVFMRRRSTAEAQEDFVRQRQLYYDNQLLDACLTNAGASAI